MNSNKVRNNFLKIKQYLFFYFQQKGTIVQMLYFIESNWHYPICNRAILAFSSCFFAYSNVT